MKKLFIAILFAFVTFTASAQFHLGGQFSINFDNEHTEYATGSVDNKEHAYMVNLKPKVYWNINGKMQVGGRIGFAFGRLTNGLIYESEKKEQVSTVNRAIGWSVSPFFGYKLLNWKVVSVWAEANVFFGQYYNTDSPQPTSSEWSNETEYGFQILPVINIDITEKLALQLHLGFISLGWYGTRADYPNKIVTTSTWDLHKGGFFGIAQGLADYGIGVVRKF